MIDDFIYELRGIELKVLLLNAWITTQEYYSNLSRSRVKRLTEFVCDFLNVQVPVIKYVDYLDDASAQTVFSINNGETKVLHTVFLRRHLDFTDEEARILLLQSIAHEVRHIWQLQNGVMEQEQTMGPYDTDEIDAIAFSRLFLEFFLLQRFIIEDQKLDDLVNKREDEIYGDFLLKIFKKLDSCAWKERKLLLNGKNIVS